MTRPASDIAEIIADLPEEEDPYPDVASYLRDRRTDGALADEDPRICHTLARISGATDDPYELTVKGVGIPIPWVTLVLGREVLDSLPPRPQRSEFLVNLKAKLLTAERVQVRGARFPVEPEAGDIAEFAWTLLQSRDSFRPGDSEGHEGTAPNQPEYDQIQLNVVIAAYAVTRAYFFSKLIQHAPVNRGADEFVAINDQDFDEGANLPRPDEAYWKRAEAALRRVKASLEAAKSQKDWGHANHRGAHRDHFWIIGELAGLLLTSLREGTVSSGGLLLLTEIAWHYLVDTLRSPAAPDTYPDWAEQLIAIDIQTDSHGAHRAPRRSRLSGIEPLGVAYDVASTAIKNQLDATTLHRSERLHAAQQLVRSGHNDSLQTHERAYWAYCEVLAAQAEVSARAKRNRETPPPPPPPAASPSESNIGSEWRTFTEVLDDLPGLGGGATTAEPLGEVQRWDQATPGGPEAPDPASATRPGSQDEPEERSDDLGSDAQAMQSVPYPVAVVTMFDIELELAMWHFYHKPFMVILPVNVVYSGGGVYKGQQAWVGYIIRPTSNATGATDAVEAICKPKPDSFFLIQSSSPTLAKVSPRIVSDKLSGSDLPIIVKLCGSPLVTLPGGPNILSTDQTPLFTQMVQSSQFPRIQSYLERASGEAATMAGRPRRATGSGIQLRHGLVIEDFHAMVAALPEANAESTLALPADLRASVSRGYWRYWTMLGVDVSDSALRYRLIGQMLGSTFGPGRPREQRRLGVALNRKRSLDRKARSLLRWKQIELIEDDPLSFTEQLLHYKDHLRDQDLSVQRQDNQQDPTSRLTWIQRVCTMDSENGHPDD